MKFLTIEELEKKLEDLKNEGYSRIHLPGGTSKDGTYCCSDVIETYNIVTRDVYFLGVPYNPNSDQNGHNKRSDESIQATAVREAMEETGLIIKEENLIYLPKSSHVCPDRWTPEKPHNKHFFLVKDFSGTVFEFEGHNPIDLSIAEPLWFPARYFKKVVFENHAYAVKEAVEILMGKSKEYAYALMNF